MPFFVCIFADVACVSRGRNRQKPAPGGDLAPPQYLFAIGNCSAGNSEITR
jgi:hypothetical protein